MELPAAAAQKASSQWVEEGEGEKMLRESEALLRGLFEQAPDAIIVVDTQGRIVRVNTQAEMMFGYSRAELVGQPLELLLPGRFREQHVAHRLGYITQPRLRPMGAAGLELLGRRKDGHELAVDIMLSPLLIAERELVIAVVRDITKRKQVEAEHAQLAAIVEFSDDAIISKTLDGLIVSWNRGAERMYGYAAVEVKGKSVSMLIPPEQPNDVAQILEKIRGGELIEHYETIRMQKNGRRIHVALTISPVKDAAGNIIGASAIGQDITEHKRIEVQLQASLREKETLLQEIHHRVKNNLQIISSLLKLQAEAIKDEKLLQILQDSQHRIRSMALIHETLYQSGDLARIDFAHYVQQLLTYLCHAYRVKSSEVQTKVTVEGVWLNLDTALACGLIINELVSNSLKHAFPEEPDMKRLPEIRIDVQNLEEQIKLTVSDNGIGFPADVDFRQTESLGLQLVNTLIIDELEGSIELDCSQGASFKLTFPHSNYPRRS